MALLKQIGKQSLKGTAKPKIPRATIQEKARRIAEERGLIAKDPQKRQIASDKAFYEPSGEAQQLKREYQKQTGLPTDRPPRIQSIDAEKSKRIADAFDEMKHDPKNPKVKSAYNQLAYETGLQYQKLLDAGIEFEYWRGRGEPYKSSREMIDDVVNNRRLKVLATEGNFGQKAITPEELAENPLLAKTKFTDPSTGKPLLVNDVFRAVHDYFGHASEGTGFGAVGEEGAWAAHMKMYSPEAQKALTTETRGQNSWVNFGRQMRRPDGTIPQVGDIDYVHPSQRLFGEQKIGLLPEEFTADEYYQLWADPKFRNIAKKAGFVAATSYFLSNPNEAEGSTFFRSLIKTAGRAHDTYEGTSILKPTQKQLIESFDKRKGEQEKLKNLGIDTTESRLIQGQPEFGLEDFEGKRMVFTMADRLAAGDEIKGIHGVEFVHPVTGEPDPVVRHGGQDFMRDKRNYEEGYVWAADPSPSAQLQKQGEIDFAETGKQSILVPWRMSETAVDHAIPTIEVMIKYARQNMSAKDIKRADNLIRENINPDFKGLKNPETIKQLSSMTSPQRKQIIHLLDRDFRDVGGLSKSEARLSVTDPKQIGAQTGGVQNVGMIEPVGDTSVKAKDLPSIDNPTYPKATRGRSKGTMRGTWNPLDLNPESAKKWGIDLENIKPEDWYKLRQASQYDKDRPLKTVFVTEDLIRAMERQGKLRGHSYLPEENIKKAVAHINNQKGSVDWNYLKKLGLSSIGFVAGLSAFLKSDDAQASLFSSSIKQSLKSFPKKAKPSEYKALLKKQKNLPQSMVDRIDESVLGDDVVSRADMESLIDEQVPKIVIADKRSGQIDPQWMEKEGGYRAFEATSNLTINDALNMLPEGSSAKRVNEKNIREQLGETYDRILEQKINKITDKFSSEEAKKEAGKLIKELKATGRDAWIDDKMALSGSLGWWTGSVERKLLHDDVLRYSPEKLREYLEADTTPEMLQRIKKNWERKGSYKKMDYEPYQLAGGTNYREIYFNLDMGAPKEKYIAFEGDRNLQREFDDIEDARQFGHMSHQPNNLAWARVTDRTGEKGEKLMQVEEVQSDASKHPELKKFLPKNWRQEILNAVMQKAQAEGYHGVSFAKTPKQVDEIEHWDRVREKTGTKFINKKTGEAFEGRSSDYYSIDLPEESGLNPIEIRNAKAIEDHKFNISATEADITGLKNDLDVFKKDAEDSKAALDEIKKRSNKISETKKEMKDKWEKITKDRFNETGERIFKSSEWTLLLRQTSSWEDVKAEYKAKGIDWNELNEEESALINMRYQALRDYDASMNAVNDVAYEIKKHEDRLKQVKENLAEHERFKKEVIDTGDYEKVTKTEYDTSSLSEGQQRVVRQYMEEMPAAVKEITGEAPQTIKVSNWDDPDSDVHELAYVPLQEEVGNKNVRALAKYFSGREFNTPEEARQEIKKSLQRTEAGLPDSMKTDPSLVDQIDFQEVDGVVKTNPESGVVKKPIKLRTPQYASVIPAVGAGAAVVGGAGYSPETQAAGLAGRLKNAAKRIGLDPEQIKVDQSGFIEYPREWIDPLSQAGEGNLRFDIGRSNDAVLGRSIPEFDTRERFGDDVYHATAASKSENIERVVDESLTVTDRKVEPDDFTEFDPDIDQRGATFASTDPEFSDRWVKNQPQKRIMPLRIDEGRRFDYENPDDVDEVVGSMDYYELRSAAQNFYTSPHDEGMRYSPNMEIDELEAFVKEKISMGEWDMIESDFVQEAIQNQGFDSFNVKEWGTKNIGVFDPARIRSKYAAFDPQFAGDPHLLGRADPKFLTGVAGAAAAATALPSAMSETGVPVPEEVDILGQINAASEEGRRRQLQEDESMMFQQEIAPETEEREPFVGKPLNIKFDWKEYPKQLGRDIKGLGEMGFMIGTGMATDSMSGLSGVSTGFLHNLADDLERHGAPDLASKIRPEQSAAQAVRGAQEQLEPSIYMPQSVSGKEYLMNVANAINWISEHGGSDVANKYRGMKNTINREVSSVFGKEAGAAAATLPDILLEGL